MNELEASEETRTANCEQHGEYQQNIFMLGKTQMKSNCPECQKINAEQARKAEDDHKKMQEIEMVKRLFKNSDLPPRFKDKTFDDYVVSGEADKRALTICRNYASAFDQRLAAGGGLVLCGKPGTGKTHLAASIANHVINEFKRSVIFISVMSAMRKVKSTYSKTSEMTESEAVESFTRPDLLILDEVGVQFGTDAEKMILFEIVNIRYQNMKPTILISNLPHNELNDYIGERVVDRMREGGGAIIPFDWASYRANV